jgi:hypothetical protein
MMMVVVRSIIWYCLLPARILRLSLHCYIEVLRLPHADRQVLALPHCTEGELRQERLRDLPRPHVSEQLYQDLKATWKISGPCGYHDTVFQAHWKHPNYHSGVPDILLTAEAEFKQPIHQWFPKAPEQKGTLPQSGWNHPQVYPQSHFFN